MEMMTGETKVCQNCKKEFSIEPEDFLFYEKIKVPPPTWCPECRMIRRFSFQNLRKLFRRKDAASGKEIFSGIPPQAPLQVYSYNYWWGDAWDPMKYGRDYDFSRPFFAQFSELMQSVPFPAKDAINLVESDYSNNSEGLKNTYLCFDCGDVENSAYVIGGEVAKESFDLYSIRHGELCYESYMIDEAFRVFFSVNCEECTDIWFSRNLYGCSNCFGCVNLRGKSQYIFNKPVSKEEYLKFILEFQSGSFQAISEKRNKALKFWKTFPMRFTLAMRVVNSTGEHIGSSRNLKCCYSIHESENLSYCQFGWSPLTDSYDSTSVGLGASLLYETANAGLEGSHNIKFSWNCWPAVFDMDYCIQCHSSSNLFGCVGLQKKSYCIFNKQYSKEDYFALREKIIKHINEMPYIDKRGRVYSYGEFFPPAFSPFAYNETTANDFFPLSRDGAEKQGYVWRDSDTKEYEITIDAQNLPDHINDVDDSVLKEIIKCFSCGKAYRIIPMELEFYRKIHLPLPRLCPECRFSERFKFVNPPKWWHGHCMCNGATSDKRQGTSYEYTNTSEHFHGRNHCPNEFETSYAPERPEIVYCETCYQNEVV